MDTFQGARVRFSKQLAVVALCLAPLVCRAWGADGHMAVGAIADAKLAGTPTAQEVAALLQPGETLRAVAVWADCAKAVTPQRGRLTYTANPEQFPECKPFTAAEFETYVQANWTQCGPPNGNEYCHHQYHYADVAIQRSEYLALVETGTHDHDIVQAISACIAKLQDRPVRAPFVFPGKREALILLVHYLGDIHQPLHIGSLYLDQNGAVLDPDAGALDARSENAGGNLLRDEGTAFHPSTRRPPPNNFHSEWDAIPPEFAVGGARWNEILAAADRVPRTEGELIAWPSRWATDGILQARLVFQGLSYEWLKDAKVWKVNGIDAAYKQRAEELQARQLAKAGARLASVLTQILAP
jgi:hypothetical protein